jgi:hypothetical protein
MASSGMLHRIALVRTDVSEELMASIITVTRIGELGTRSVLTRATLRNIPEDAILHENIYFALLKSIVGVPLVCSYTPESNFSIWHGHEGLRG